MPAALFRFGIPKSDFQFNHTSGLVIDELKARADGVTGDIHKPFTFNDGTAWLPGFASDETHDDGDVFRSAEPNTIQFIAPDRDHVGFGCAISEVNSRIAGSRLAGDIARHRSGFRRFVRIGGRLSTA
jgi:hypothetical protein